jgi:probable F420-dependent oxidoreductase
MKIGLDADITQSMLPVPELARLVEDAGFESLFFMQCTHVPADSDESKEPGHEEDQFVLDPLIALAVAGAATSQLMLGTGAIYPAFYDPLVLARQLATLDHALGGRLIVGVTPGYNAERFRNHGIEFGLRWRVFREKCLAVRGLWTQDKFEFHGEFVNFEPVLLGLTPLQKPNPPMLIGSHGPTGLRRAVEFGDAWFPVLHSQLDLEADLKQLGELAAEAGRDAPPATVFLWQPNAEQLERCAQAGVERCVVAILPRDRKTVDEFLDKCAPLVKQFA